IGAKLAQSNRQVVAICGDGSFQMQMMELATIAQNKLPIKIILMNNSRLGMVREVQDNQYKGNQTAVFLDGNPDFVRLATAYSIKSKRISSDQDIDSAIEELLNCDEAFLLECIVSPKEATL
ncbi:MAG: thiamine pyrophosphate-dependent enzyme, partial [Oscillospiraceae bacterium]